MVDISGESALPRVPEFSSGKIPGIKVPEHPSGYGIKVSPSIINETRRGEIIGEPTTMLQELKAISELVPQTRRKELDTLADQLLDPENGQDPTDAFRSIQDPTDREYAMRSLVHSAVFRGKTNGKMFSFGDMDALERTLFTEHQLKLKPPIKRSF